MATLYTQQSRNVQRTWLLMSLFFIVLIALGWVFARVWGNPVILYFFVGFSVLMNILSYWYSDKIALGLAGAQPIEKSQAPELYNVVENLCITAGLPLPKIYIINDPAPNAFATGRDKEHAAIAVTSGLLQIMTKTELEGVIAHELSHIGNRDILLSSAVVVLVGLIAVLSDVFLRSMWWRGRGRNDREGQAGAILMVIGIVLAILSPIIATLIQLAISRKREFLADTDGALLTRYPEGLASALVKIDQYDAPMRRASNSTAHLWIASPWGPAGLTGAIHRLFLTHPPVEERVKILREMD